jgi:tRNA (cytidine/uridine-2'-O-)-methyltransferase
MFEIVLYQPEIPPNTGNILRLAANTGCRVHLVKPLGFRTDARSLRRSSLDYADLSAVVQHESWEACRGALDAHRMFALTTRGTHSYHSVVYQPGDALVFGPETRGLPDAVLAQFGTERCLRIPMQRGSRSLNLSNAAAVVVYEAWRQLGFRGS